MDFKTFATNYKTGDKKNEKATQNDNYDSMIKQYEGMSQDQLVDELLSQTRRLKNDGKWDSKEMDKIAYTLAPYLNEQQKQMLEQLKQTLNND